MVLSAKALFIAIRIRTLVASIAPVLIGLSLSIHDNNFTSYAVALLTIITANDMVY